MYIYMHDPTCLNKVVLFFIIIYNRTILELSHLLQRKLYKIRTGYR